MGVRVGKIITPTGVNVGSRVAVLRCVAVGTRVDTEAVCVDATAAVWAMNVLIAFGSSGGTGVMAAGTHAMTSAKIINQGKSFFTGDCIFIHSYQD